MNMSELKAKLDNNFMDMLYEVYSPGIVDEILRSYKDGRKTTLRVNTLKSSINDVSHILRKKGFKFNNCSFLKEAVLFSNIKESDIYNLPIYENGQVYVQNLSSMIPPLFLELKEGLTVLDMCAAPGSKTTQIASMMNNNGKIVANEINFIRRERLKYNIYKQGSNCVEVIGEDGKKLGRKFLQCFDRVLIDAPCSGEGTIHMKKNESYRKWSSNRVNKNSKIQKKLLESGVNCLKPGGILVYSTCTISPEENEAVVDYILNKYDNLKVDEVKLPAKNCINGLTVYKDNRFNRELKNSLRIIPNKHMEGFFLCKISKK